MSEALAFRSALQRGLGRAMLLLRKMPDAVELRDELLNACKHDLVYDHQAEVSCAPYLYNLIHEIEQDQGYWSFLISMIIARDTSNRERYHDNVQIFQTLCMIAAANHTFDCTMLRNIISKSNFDAFVRECMGDFVKLQGIDGFVFCFKTYANVIEAKDQNETWSFRGLTDALIERDGQDVATAATGKARADDPDLDRLLHLLNADDGAESQAEALADRDAVVAHVAQNKRIPWEWVRAANQDDLDWAASKVLEAHGDKEAIAYLRVFDSRPFPEPLERLFPLVRSAKTQVAHVTVKVLGQLKDAGIRALALELLLEGSNPAGVVRLLRSNFQPGDFSMIEALLIQTVNDENIYHNIGLAILNLLADTPAALQESRNALLHLYENEPCSLCRYYVVANLAAINAVPAWMAEECQYDCVPETAALVRTP